MSNIEKVSTVWYGIQYSKNVRAVGPLRWYVKVVGREERAGKRRSWWKIVLYSGRGNSSTFLGVSILAEISPRREKTFFVFF